MAIKIHALLFVGAVLGFMCVALAIPGTSTYNTIYVPSACYGYQDEGVMIAAVSDELWDDGAACGRIYQVTCTGPTNEGVPQPCRGSTTVKIVDRCPSPACQATLDLSQEAFSMMADPAAGKVTIDYNQV